MNRAGSGSLDVRVRDLGGIESQAASFEPGVTVLVGRNATNRTSLLQSVSAALGGSIGELRGSAEEGAVELDLGGETYVRKFRRADDGRVHVEGSPYTDDAAVVDLFAALVEANPIRSAVERADGDELRELLMEPVDTEALTADVEATRRELRSVEDRLDEVDRQLGNLPALEERRRQKADALADLEDELDDVRSAVEALEADVEADAEASAVAEELVAELQSVRGEHRRVRDDRETQADAIESLEADLTDVEAELADLDVPESEIGDVEDELERLRRRKRELSTTVSNLLSIVEFNEELVGGSEALPGQRDDDPVGQLDPSSQTLECWTCGTSVERQQIEGRLDDLRDVVDEKREEQASVEASIEEQRRALEELREHSDRRDELRERRSEIGAELERRRERVEALEERSSSLRERVQELEAETGRADASDDEVDDAEMGDRETGGEADDAASGDGESAHAATADGESGAGSTAELLEQSRRLSELEYERGQLEESIERLEDEIAAAEALSAERDRLEDRREELETDLAALRGRVEDLETSAIETFNEHVATVLERLDYENVERIWFERTFDGDDGVAATSALADDRAATFDLHVVRAADDGAVYEDTIDHLSESEREVIGLVVALAGYLVHDVHETVPVMVLDSLEAIDANRIAALVEYLADYAPYLIVALLPGDARALPDTYDRIETGVD